jgi:hypothetical protein
LIPIGDGIEITVTFELNVRNNQSLSDLQQEQ